MKLASSKVLFRPNSVLNQTSTSVSLITTISIVIKISTAILRFMAPANYSGTFPGIIRESWEVQVNLVSKTLRIRLRRAELTLRDVSDSEEEEHVEKVSVQVVATGVSTRNRLREWRNESQILKDKAARKKNDEMQEAWRKKNDDFMKSAKKKKNKKETRRLKMRLHDKTIKGILSQTLF